jgi:hypothetical protein
VPTGVNDEFDPLPPTDAEPELLAPEPNEPTVTVYDVAAATVAFPVKRPPAPPPPPPDVVAFTGSFPTPPPPPPATTKYSTVVGVLAGTTALLAALDALVPMLLVAVTVNV